MNRLRNLTAALCAAVLVPAVPRAHHHDTAGDLDNARQLDRIDVSGQPLPGPALKRKSTSATRLQLDLLDLPASADMLDQDELRRRGQTTLRDALRSAPGLVAAYSFGVLNVAGRGFSGVMNSPTLFDGIRYPGWQVSPRLSLNYHQVEVLRGPAALAAGQGSIAGAINLVPRRADGSDENRLYLGLGRFGTTTAAVGHGGSIGRTGTLNYRVDLSHQGSASRGSFGHARDTSFEFHHVNAELAIPVTDALTLSLALESFRDDAEGYFGTPLIDGRVDPRLREINYNVLDDHLDMRVHWLRARAEWTPDDMLSGRVIMFANDEKRGWRNTESYTWLPEEQRVRRGDFLHIDHHQRLRGLYGDLSWRHELLGREHELVVGMQADRNDHDRYNDSPFRYQDTVPLFPEQRGVYTSLDDYGLRTATDIEQRSLFAESQWRLSEHWRLVSGLRHDQSKVDSRNALSSVRFDKRYRASSYRLGAVYSPTSTLRAYVSLSTSSEPPAQITTLGLANAAFDLTRARQTEIGLKQDTNWGHWTVALYELSRRNLLSRDPDDPNRVLQVGEQAAHGIEWSARIEVSPRWQLEGHVSALNARFRRFDQIVAGQTVSRRGNTPVAVPERVGALWLHYQATDPLRLSLGSRGVGRSYADTANTVELPGYATVDLMVRYQTSTQGEFALHMRNAGDKIYATRPYGPNQVLIGEPRWYELSWQYAF